jgi:putative drug exporter of the RND superfamily
LSAAARSRRGRVRAAVPAGFEQHGKLALIAAVLTGDPYSATAAGEVKLVGRTLRSVSPGALVDGVPADNLDIQQTNARDTRVLVPAVLLVVLVILCVLLFAFAAPAYLIITVVASFAATLGLITIAFTQFFGHEGLAFNLVLISFIFPVALGVDYNIFLMHRVRQESERVGTRDGTLRALVATESVVIGAGIILAGTFGALALLPLEPLVQIGATVSLGVLIDTFIVRALLVPSLTYIAGGRAWWPAASPAVDEDT